MALHGRAERIPTEEWAISLSAMTVITASGKI